MRLAAQAIAFLAYCDPEAQAITLSGSGGATAADVALWDQVLAAVPAGDTTVMLGDQIVPLAVARAWRNRVAAMAAGRQPSSALSAQTNVVKWTNGNVYYSFSANVTANHQAAFLSASKEWELAANVHFMARTAEANYIVVNDSGSTGGNNATVGMVGGPQSYNIGSTSWNRPTLVHELGHTLGVIHEHQRANRDSFVTVNMANVASGAGSNFTKMPTSDDRSTYDFLSVMHYARDAFTMTTGTDTITPLAAYASLGDLMGRQFNPVLSRSDRQGMASLYGASLTTPSLVVTSVADSGAGTLRAALVAAQDMAEDFPGTKPAVSFQIPLPTGADPNFAGGTFILRLSAPLQPQANTIVNGDTEGNNNSTGPEIRLTRATADAVDTNGPGVQMVNANSELRAIAIDGFGIAGVEITGTNAAGNTVAGCYIGTTPKGTAAAANLNEGVLIRNGAHGNIIGGTTTAARNLISGNSGNGVALAGSGTTGNLIEGNWIGLNVGGTAALPNGMAGVIVHALAGSNVIGGTVSGAGNVLSGNTGQGVYIAGPADGNAVLGNYIGTTPTGTTALGNTLQGIIVFNAATNTAIGGVAAGAGNVISGNKQQGLSILGTGTTGTKVAGNYVGVDIGGVTAMGNGTGATKYPGMSIYSSAQQTVIGGTTAAERNVISGNGQFGIGISDAGTSLNTVSGNYIGLGADGATAVPNLSSGIIIFNAASGMTIGGLVPDAGNVISGNGAAGVELQAATGNTVAGNFIGLNAAGLLARANAAGGVVTEVGATGNTIGAAFEGRNYISGNTGAGVDLEADGNVVKGNTIGLNVVGSAVGNTTRGVLINAKNNAIGGSGMGEANRISGNGGSGLVIYNSASTGNAITGNAIYGNSLQAIDLYEGSGPYTSGQTVNDSGDGDTGPNNLQNFPALTGAALTTVTTVGGSLNSTASSTFRLEFFASPSGGQVGEMQTYLGSASVTTNASGNATFSTPLAAVVPPGYTITATATNSTNNTSEAAPGVTVTVVDSDHDGLPDAWESANGLVVGTNDAALDPDGDGFSNLAEFYAGTLPKNGLSRLQPTQVQKVGNDFRITVPTVSGRTYQLEYNDNLSNATGWRMLADQILGTAGNLQITDPGAFAHSQRFYRMRLAQ